MKLNILLPFALLSLISLSACQQAEQPSSAPSLAKVEVNLTNLHRDIKALASDEFAGRGPLTVGEDLTIAYLAKQYQALGLMPGNQESYYQAVPMAKVTADQSMQLVVGEHTFSAGRDFTARTQQVGETISLVDSELVFVGYGINAPEYQWNDYADVDVKGKTVVVLVNDPGFATQDQALFTGNAMTYYGRWTYKYEEAARQGAKAVFIIHQTAPAAYPWSVVESSNTGSKYTLVDNDNNQSKLPIMGWIQQQVAETIFSAAGLSLNELQALALRRDFSAIDLQQSANLTLNNKVEYAESNNVLAMIPGESRADEYIVIGAHWDHFGTKQTEQGAKIYNGAIDNATGTAATVELARILMAQHKVKPFQRSILFVNFTAEETGLIGSELFALGGVVPTKNMVALLNIDGMNALAAVDYILQYGQGMSEMETYLADAAAQQQRKVKMDPRPQNGLFFRSDHFSLAKQGVPSLLFMSLGDTDPDYIAHKYHKEADDYSPLWSLGGMEQDIQLIAAIARKLANNDDWPKWLADSDFKSRRLQDRQ
ncbi:Zn-dependent amino-or carboxypeptidase, M28 family [Colwellia chukchiensis]|uniref:Zn-dependent amino-or carboxypeptidase, M28 family n=1 Tax=Colwellia chukchiensis TaxID=641665 RepID=A0A1H7JBK9_9GAMM|nr:M28 family metallopeptidase [Colwellia chukchiensis]SEK71896.1 Zn-dependent amino-or carboxypeptidase, M28 family [Colwellia chukchiensis]